MTRHAMLIAALGLSACGVEAPATAQETAITQTESHRRVDTDIPLKEAKLIIEHNATARDTGFQVIMDGEPWKELVLTAPNGRRLLTVKPQGSLGRLGFTELFLETNEPANDEVPIEEVLANLPPGRYEMDATSVDGPDQEGLALLTHAIPAGPEITSPAEGAVVDPAKGLVVRWKPVTETITGEPVTIVAYEVIVEKDELPHPNAIAKPGMDVHVPPSVRKVTVPKEVLEARTAYLCEVLAIEESGNQTLSECVFETE